MEKSAMCGYFDNKVYDVLDEKSLTVAIHHLAPRDYKCKGKINNEVEAVVA